MRCKNCGADVGIEYRLCPYCRTELEYPSNPQNVAPPTIVINNVVPNSPTNAVPPNQQYQPYQQQSQPVPVQPNQPMVYGNGYCSPKSKILTLILCLFLGVLGIHHFYAGKVGMGIVYFFTVGLFGFGWLYDIIKIASGTFKDGNGLPISQN